MKITAVSLLEMNENYVQAAWSLPNTDVQAIAIYRKPISNSNKFYIECVSGPWSVVENGELKRDTSIYQEEYSAILFAAMDLFAAINKDLDSAKSEWTGVLYDL